ncbi:hypothetical protein CBF61_00705 [Lactobacillus taiwanensis]|nr:hypothetical protein CBF64_09805 [Lactobacillus taiwanensis]OYS00526.1 hypothetical protein CBF68_10195 [Lactobacillus taiwanensis]OYS03382.1 hypothetical protein CBF61_00705 [Lactobacillus taiwanensis]
MNKYILKRMEAMIIKHVRLSILFLLIACSFYFLHAEFFNQYNFYSWYWLLLVAGKLFEYLGIIILATPIFEFVNLRRELKKNEQAKKRNQKISSN